uniref:centrosomal protein of 290 kDa-like isoform X2 n=1 Tax=Styela clava TaxID=7725 RepID=UPI001939BCAA|nr:centrosomal protein of 290 kDa-like isoform X2 [Styela clava]
MAPNIDWATVGTVAQGSSTVDDETIDRVVEDLRTVKDADFKNEPDKLIMLFKSALNILDHREQEYEALLDEQVKSVNDKDSQIEELKRRLEDERRFGSGGAGGLRGDTEYIRAENRNLAELVEGYKEQERELRIELEEMSRDRYTFERENNEMKQQVKDLKLENQELKSDLRDFRDIMEKQHRERLGVKGHIDSEMKDKLTEKNNQITDLLDQITELEKVNKDLESKNHGVRDEMERAQQDMEKMADEYEKMKRVIDGTDQYSENIQKENAAYKLQVADLREQLKGKNEEVDAIVETVNTKVEEWKNRMTEKDRLLTENARTIAALQDQINSAALDQDRIRAEQLTKKLKEKEEQIKQLQTSLEQVINDLDAQTAIVQDLRKDSGTNREIIGYKNQIKTLQSKIKQLEDSVADAETHRLAAEGEARDKDQKLNAALKRIDDIESGEYGLSEAVHEIKECKNQIKVRDQNIEELIRQVNQLEEKLNDILEENDEFRERLGINPRDLTDIAKMRKSRALRQQQYRAENQILLKEIERLEDERIEMKHQIRSQAQTYSQRAVSEGLHQDDIDTIEEFIEELKRKRKIGKPVQPKNVRFSGSSMQQANWKMDELNKQADQAETHLQMSQAENTRLKQERKSLQKENVEMKNAMKEILEAIKNSKEDGTSGSIEIPSLERLINAIEVQNIHGEYEPALHMKAQVDQLTGRNEELRQELRSTRGDFAAASGEKANYKSQNEVLKAEVATLSKLAEGKGGKTVIHTIPLPDNIEPTYADIITALNEQLMQVMNDVAKRDEKLKNVNESLEQSRRQFHLLRHQNHLVYKEHLDAKKKWEIENKNKDGQIRILQEQSDKDSVRVQELDRLLDSLQRDPDTVKQRLAETTRKISLLRVNEKTLIRHHKALESSEEQLHIENNRLRNEILLMEKAVSERLGYLERYKDMAAYKIAALQKNMDSCVPEIELENINRKYDELTAKYRDLLQKENQFVAKNTKVETLQAEIKILNEEIESLRKELSIEKEKRHTLGEALQRAEGLSSQTGSTRGSKSMSKDAINYEISAVMKKVTVLEMKELNERQRAEHSTRMFSQIKSTVDALENRNMELEHKFSELTKMNLTSQKTERELRDELAAAVPLSVSEADRKKISKLEEESAKTRVRMSQLQDMADIAQNQLKTLQSQQHGREREMRSLREQVREFQIQSDDKSLIGKLHRQIVNLQSVEADQKLKIEKITIQVRKLEAHVLRQEKLIDEKELMVYHVRTETTTRNRQLKKTIQSLRQQFSGALPLHQQEKFSQSMIRLQEDKARIQDELKRVRKEREGLEDKLAEAEIKEEGLLELKKTIKDGRGAQKLEEWCKRMDALRLQDLKLQRQVVRQNEEIKYLEKTAAQHEKTIAAREEDIVEMLRNQEKQQLEWEQRETQLERMLDDFDMKRREVSKKAKRLEDIPSLIPDPTLPLDIQLTRALKTVSEQTTRQKDLISQLKFHENDNDRLKNRVQVLEGDLFTRDRMINDLRMRIPEGTTANDVRIIKSEIGLESGLSQQLHVAKQTIETLKKRLKQKEDSIESYKKLLEESRTDHESAVKQHENQLSSMQKRIHSKADEAFGRFRQVALDAVAKKSSKAPTSSQLARLSELEELVQEQDVALTALMERVKAANADIRKHKETIESVRRHAERERSKIFDEHEHIVRKLKDEISSKERSMDDLERDAARMKLELQQERESNTRAPSVTMKNLVVRLRSQLEEKDAQQKKLSQAITELRADLVQQAQENVRAASEGVNTNAAMQALVQKRTESYRDEVDELKDKLALVQRGLKQERQKQEKLKTELKQILDEMEKKDLQMNRLKNDKQKLDQENERLRDKVRRLAKTDDRPGSGNKIKFTNAGATFSVPNKSNHDSDEDVDTESSDDKDDVQEEIVQEDVIVPQEAGKTKSSGKPPSSKLPKSTVTIKFGSGSGMEEKNNKIRQLEDEVKKLKVNLEKAQAPSKNEVELAKWEAKKLWQNRVDALRTKLQDKDKTIQQLEKQITSLRDTVSRLERDKLRRVGGSGAPIHAVGQNNESAVVDRLARQDRHKIEDLSRRLHDLAEENSKLKRENQLPRDIIVAEMEAKNKTLAERLEDLEKEITMKGVRPQVSNSIDQLQRDRENKFQSDLLKLYAENAELKFEVEQSKLDIPRLKDRVEDQQRYIELLKAEKREAEIKADKSKIGQHKKQGKDLGSTGKSPAELERMLGMMKKVVERVQRENDTLKKAPGVVSNEIFDATKKENAQLKQRIDMMSRQIGGQLSSRYESKTQGVERLMKENERLRKDLNKESTAHEKIKASKASLQSLYEKQRSEIEKLNEKLRVAESKTPRVAGLGSKGYNSVVTNKMLETKLKKAEQELGDKKSQINDLKIVLQDSAKRENELHDENEKLKEQIEILERFPPEAGGSDANTVRELQQARVKINELEKANKDLEEMLQVLRRHIASSKEFNEDDILGSSMDNAMLAKLKQYDSTLEKNTKLNTDLVLTKQERDRLKEEISRLEKELSNFNDDFFDEIEDLKYNYAEAVKRNVLYEEQLRNLSKQFGVQVDIQDDDATKS